MNKLLPIILVFATMFAQAQNYVWTEDFESIGSFGDLPDGWTQYNEDALAGQIHDLFLTEGWIGGFFSGLEDQGLTPMTSAAAMSCSWYDPAGTADDWLISPPVQLSNDPGAELEWYELAPGGAQFVETYEVYVSTSGGQLSSFEGLSPVYSSSGAADQYTVQSVDLTDFAGAEIHIAFRNNTNDGLFLAIDDIGIIAPPSDVDGAITSMPHVTYSEIPMAEVDFSDWFSAMVENKGSTDLNNVRSIIEIDTLDADNNFVNLLTAETSSVGSLAPGEMAEVMYEGTFMPEDAGRIYAVRHTITFDGDDLDPNMNDQSRAVYFQVTESEWGVAAWFVPTGDETYLPGYEDWQNFYWTTNDLDADGNILEEREGWYGYGIEITEPVYMDYVYALSNGPSGDVSFSLYDFTGGNLGEKIADSDFYILEAGTNSDIPQGIFLCPQFLDAGRYFISINAPLEGDANVLGANHYYTEGNSLSSVDGGAPTAWEWAPWIFVTTLQEDELVYATEIEAVETHAGFDYEFEVNTDGSLCELVWTANGDVIAEDMAIVPYQFMTPGDYEVCVSGTTPDGDLNSCVDVTIVCDLDISVDAAQSSATIDVNNATGDIEIDWSTGTDNELTNDSLSPGQDYSVTVTDETGCEETIDFTTPECNLQVGVQVNGSLAIAQPQGQDGVVTYELYDTEVNLISSGTNNFFQDLAEGTYILNLIDEAGCTASTNFTIEATSIEDLSFISSFELSPVPATNQITIKSSFENAQTLNIEFFNIIGERMMSYSFENVIQLNETIDVSNLPIGTYFVQMNTETASGATSFVVSR